MVANVGANHFPGELRVALHASGLTLEAIQRRLTERGFPVGRSTLSYWQNGRRLPTEPKSLLAVAALEDILKVPTGRFTDALRSPGSLPGKSDLEMATAAARIAALMEGVGCPGGLSLMEQVNTVAIIEFGPRGGLRIIRNIEIHRALVDTDRLPIIYGGEPGGDANLIRHEAISGGRIGRVRRDNEANVVVSEIVFDRVIHRGDFHLLHYLSVDNNDQESLFYYQLVTDPRAMRVLDFGFHRDRLPVRIEEFERAVDNGPDLYVRERVLSPDHRVAIVRERTRRGVAGLRWEYA